MVTRYFDGVVPDAGAARPIDERLRDAERVAVTAAADAAIDRFAIHEAIAAIWELVDELNGYITEQEPWVLAKDPANARAARAPCSPPRCTDSARSRCCSRPVIPEATAQLWAALGGDGAVSRAAHRPRRASGRQRHVVHPARAPLFPRIEAAMSA